MVRRTSCLAAALTASNNLRKRTASVSWRAAWRRRRSRSGSAARPATRCPRGLERIKLDAISGDRSHRGEHRQHRARAISRNWRRFYFDRGKRLFDQGNDRDAMAELNRGLFLLLSEANALRSSRASTCGPVARAKALMPPRSRCGATKPTKRTRCWPRRTR